MPGSKGLSSSSLQGLAFIVAEFQSERKETASTSVASAFVLPLLSAEQSFPFQSVTYCTLLGEDALVWEVGPVPWRGQWLF